MDEKTEKLREIFIDTTGAEEVTESQEETPGSLTGGDENAAAEERISRLVAVIDEQYGLTTSLTAEKHERIVYGVFEEKSDTKLADELDVERSTVFIARMDLHLVSEADREAPVSLEYLQQLILEDAPIPERAATLESDEATIRHYSRVVAADLESTRANHRFRDAFRDLLTDANLEESHAAGAQEDGLAEAAEDIETNVSF